MIQFKKPATGDYAPYFQRYIDLVEDGSIQGILRLSAFETIIFLENLTEEQWLFRYEENKWSIKESMVHLMDTERVMAYRALRLARKDTTELPGFDHTAYVPASQADERKSESIIEEYQAVRQATIQLFNNIPSDSWERNAIASGHKVTVRALAYIIAGHEKHHMKIFKAKYLRS